MNFPTIIIVFTQNNYVLRVLRVLIITIGSLNWALNWKKHRRSFLYLSSVLHANQASYQTIYVWIDDHLTYFHISALPRFTSRFKCLNSYCNQWRRSIWLIWLRDAESEDCPQCRWSFLILGGEESHFLDIFFKFLFHSVTEKWDE